MEGEITAESQKFSLRFELRFDLAFLGKGIIIYIIKYLS